jgi:hypothetical protein
VDPYISLDLHASLTTSVMTTPLAIISDRKDPLHKTALPHFKKEF